MALTKAQEELQRRENARAEMLSLGLNEFSKRMDYLRAQLSVKTETKPNKEKKNERRK